MKKNKAIDIFDKFFISAKRHCRRRIIACVLSTDMFDHEKTLSNFNLIEENKNNLKNYNEKNIFYNNQQAALSMIIHSADISNPAKPLNVYLKWVDRLFKEFFHQGDIEREMGIIITSLCDRRTTDINASQIYFISHITKTSFDRLFYFSPQIKCYCDKVMKNFEFYSKLVEEQKQKKNNVLI